MGISTFPSDQTGNFQGLSPMSSLGKTRQIPYKAGNVRPSKTPVRQMDAPETERFVFLLKEVLVKKGISQRELSRRLGIKIGTLTRYLKGDVNPYDVKLGIQRALTEELGVTMATLYSKLDGTEAPSEITVRDVSSWIRSNATPEDMATLFQSQQEAQLRHLERLTTSNKTSRPGWIPIDDERAEVISGLQNYFFEKISEVKGLSKKEAWTELKAHFEIFLNEKEISKMQEVAFGMDTWPPEMMEETILRTWPDRCQIQQAFQNWAGFGEFPNVATMPTSEVGAIKDQLYEMVASAKQ
tara:strand:+ start:1281 stop:2174 length:894 start_codon:yes stop_codon:yes gene_type:complete